MYQKMGERSQKQAKNLSLREPSQTFLTPALSLVCQLQKEGTSRRQRTFLRYLTRGRRHQRKTLDALEALPDLAKERRVHTLDTHRLAIQVDQFLEGNPEHRERTLIYRGVHGSEINL